jgi:cytochrome P450
MTDAAPLSPAVPKPAHVPDAVVHDFDLFLDPALIANPRQRLLDLLEKAPPVFWTPRNGGHWIVLDYAANFKAARDTETFSNEVIPMVMIEQFMASLPPGTPRVPLMKPISVDPPEHSKFRMPLQRVFSPKVVNALEGDIRSLTNKLIDNVSANGGCEFISEIAEPMPVQIFLKMMGLPSDRQPEYRVLVKASLSGAVQDMSHVVVTLQNIVASMRDTILERREHPRDDIISMLWKIGIDGKPATLEHVEDYCALLFFAGLDTVINAMGFGVCHLAQDLPLQQQLRANPRLIPEASEELLRSYTFVPVGRRIAKDTVFEGLKMEQNEQVKLFLPSANLDKKQFTGPDNIDLRRENKAHIAFNAGPHRCLGSHLARLELQVLYEQLLARLPTFRLDQSRPPVFHGGHIFGVDSLHLVWK